MWFIFRTINESCLTLQLETLAIKDVLHLEVVQVVYVQFYQPIHSIQLGYVNSKSCILWIKFSLCLNGYKRVFKELLTTSGEAQFQVLHTLALLCGKWQTLGSVWWVASAADAGARATVGGTGNFAAHWRTLPWRREWGSLSSEVVSVLSGKAEVNARCYNLNGAKIRNAALRANELFSSYKTILSCKPISATIFFRGSKTQEPFCFGST